MPNAEETKSIIEEMREEARALRNVGPAKSITLIARYSISDGWVHWTLSDMSDTTLAEGKQRTVNSAKFMAEDAAYARFDYDKYSIEIIYEEAK